MKLPDNSIKRNKIFRKIGRNIVLIDDNSYDEFSDESWMTMDRRAKEIAESSSSSHIILGEMDKENKVIYSCSYPRALLLSWYTRSRI